MRSFGNGWVRVRLINWNVRSPSEKRAAAQAEWLVASGADVIVLTELRAGSAGLATLSRLLTESYTIRIPEAEAGNYIVLIASRKGTARVVDLPLTAYTHRAVGFIVDTPYGATLLVGVYVPSRGPAHARNLDKSAFQTHLAERLPFILGMPGVQHTIVAGDLNVVERGHVPHHDVFGEWEYLFYDAFASHGLLDAYRLVSCQIDHSWFGRSGRGYRFDHSFVSSSLAPHVASCNYVHSVRADGLSDHSAMQLSLGSNAACN